MKNILLIYSFVIFYLFTIFFSSDLLLVVSLLIFPLIFILCFYKDKKIYLNDSLVFFLICFTLYGFFAPYSEIFLHGYLSQPTRLATILYSSAIVGLLIGVLFNKKYPSSTTYINMNANIKWYSQLFILLIIFVLIITKVISAGFDYKRFFNIGSGERHTVTQFWVVTSYIITGLYLFCIYYWKSFKKSYFIIIMLSLLFYILLQLSIGNRRDFISIALGIFAVYSFSNKKRYTLFSLLTLLSCIIFMMFFSSIRAGYDSLEDIYLDSLTSNEFTYPFYTLSISIENNYNDWLYGFSIFIMPFAFFVPRVIWEEKVNSLASEFVLVNFGKDSMGYAFTPVTEAYMNFGILGPFIFFFFIGYLLISPMVSIKRNNLISIFSFLFFSLTLDFCRGEVSSFLYQLFFVSLPFIIFHSISFKR
jgi:oligosaccharide repeat unit polymerase